MVIRLSAYPVPDDTGNRYVALRAKKTRCVSEGSLVNWTDSSLTRFEVARFVSVERYGVAELVNGLSFLTKYVVHNVSMNVRQTKFAPLITIR